MVCHRLLNFTVFFLLALLATGLRADEPSDKKSADSQPPPTETSARKAPPAFKLKKDVREAIQPLFSSIANAKVSRATVEMLTDSLVGGTVLESSESTFQVASRAPDQFTVYLKEPEQRTRAYCNGKAMVVALASDAYMRMKEPISMQDAVTSLPVPLGPYPEPLLALTLAGVDPAITFVGGMRSLEIVDRDDFRGKTPSVHFKGVQADNVTWDLWISRGKNPQPLRVLIDLTPMLIASDDFQVPDNFSYQVRYDFLSWRVTGDIAPSLFTYKPPKAAKEYDSLEHYYESIAGAMAEHPLLGKPAPNFESELMNGRKVSSKALAGKVVVLDFWATWCVPCKAAMPVLKEVADQYARKGVVLLALNTGEERSKIQPFLKEQNLNLNVLLDPEGKIADAFSADAIPLTFVIGKSGIVESVHTGFLGEDALKQRLRDELDVLTIGGKIASSEADAE